MKKKIVTYTLMLSLVAFLVWFSHSFLSIGPTEIRDWILSFGIFSSIFYVVIYILRPLILFPASVLSIAGGLAFGAFKGTLYTIIGATGGAVLSFLVARYFGKNIAAKEWKGNKQKIQRQLEKNGFFYVLFLRFIPLFNFDLISYSAGLSKVRLSSFALGTFLGIIPGTFAYNFLGSSLVAGNPEILLLASAVFITLMIVPLLIRNKMKKKQG
ncbi:TVP38/TMEM64 family protein [Bacillus sp. SCS-153A]|uniref:TVP38/TMEM64 family protein n=1 Tax=Rossellomorea sedimentorum TaxID=3115294 RepID=UPI00390623E3